VLVVSLLFITGAATLLVLGLWQSSTVLLAGSIAASLFAAVMLVVGARRYTSRLAAAADRSLADGELAEEPGAPLGATDSSTTQTMTIPAQGGASGGGGGRAREAAQTPPSTPAGYPDDEADPPDEPAPQQVSPADAARVGRMRNEVLVVDGRPRYHLPGCVHLLGRESEPLPVGEAIELGFTPCSLCEPDSALLADARRV
jgi:hypothetical protein